MTVYYVDNKSATASNQNTGTSQNAPLLSLAGVNARSFKPGDVIAFKAGTSYDVAAAGTGALVIMSSGTSDAPITFTSYGAGEKPVIGNLAGGYSDGILVKNASYVVIDGLKVDGAGQAGVNITSTSHHIKVQNSEATHVGEGFLVAGQSNLITNTFIHDLHMVKNTPHSVNTDDDYGATGIVVAGSNNEFSFNKIVNAKALSYDYGVDGGGFELYGSVSNIRIHDNWVEGSQGFMETGGYRGSISDVSVSNNTSLNNKTFLVLHNASGGFGGAISGFDVHHNTFVEETNAAKQMATVFLDGKASPDQLRFHHNIVSLNDGDSVFKQNGTYHTDNLFYLESKNTHLYNNWSMTLNAGEIFALADPLGADLLPTGALGKMFGSTLTESSVLTGQPNPGPVVIPPVPASDDAHFGVHRYYDVNTHDHFYTSSMKEKNSIDDNYAQYRYEGVQWSTPAEAANTIDVFRFYDVVTGAHFFTTSVGERDSISKNIPSYQYEGVAFQAYGDGGGAHGLMLERFYNTETHVHHYAASQGETDWINAGNAGSGWIDEGHGFMVHIPEGGTLLI